MKTIEDELYISQDKYDEESRHVAIFLDDHGENQVDLEFRINDEGEYQLRCISAGGSFSPSYYFSKVSEHVRLTEVSEHCNMIPPDFELIDPIRMTPTEPNEEFRRSGMRDFKSKYEWSREKQDWVIKEEEE
tara:strand:+ start:2009 stop:2404 length:396 start_codon:yes stop_codon:yes gene_type:complete